MCQKLRTQYPKAKIPSMPRKVLFVAETDIKERRVIFDEIFRSIAKDTTLASSLALLEFLGKCLWYWTLENIVNVKLVMLSPMLAYSLAKYYSLVSAFPWIYIKTTKNCGQAIAHDQNLLILTRGHHWRGYHLLHTWNSSSKVGGEFHWTNAIGKTRCLKCIGLQIQVHSAANILIRLFS